MSKRPTKSELAAQPAPHKAKGTAPAPDVPEPSQVDRMRAWGDKAAFILRLVGYQHLADDWRIARKGG